MSMSMRRQSENNGGVKLATAQRLTIEDARGASDNGTKLTGQRRFSEISHGATDGEGGGGCRESRSPGDPWPHHSSYYGGCFIDDADAADCNHRNPWQYMSVADASAAAAGNLNPRRCPMSEDDEASPLRGEFIPPAAVNGHLLSTGTTSACLVPPSVGPLASPPPITHQGKSPPFIGSSVNCVSVNRPSDILSTNQVPEGGETSKKDGRIDSRPGFVLGSDLGPTPSHERLTMTVTRCSLSGWCSNSVAEQHDPLLKPRMTPLGTTEGRGAEPPEGRYDIRAQSGINGAGLHSLPSFHTPEAHLPTCEEEEAASGEIEGVALGLKPRASISPEEVWYQWQEISVSPFTGPGGR